MNILFVADPLESFKIYKDTTFAMMREAQRAVTPVHACEPTAPAVAARECGSGAGAKHPPHRPSRHGLVSEEEARKPCDTQGLQRRCDAQRPTLLTASIFTPPTCWSRPSAKVPRSSTNLRALRDHPEKLAIWSFPSSSALRWSRATLRKSSAFMPSTRTSFSNRWTAWGVWASSVSGTMA
jgi:glutathione synthase